MVRTHCILGLLCLVASGALAQTTTVTGTITDPEGDLLQGSCSIQAVAPFTAPSGWRVVGTPMVVNFQGGSFAATLVPTDSASPSGQYYKVTCMVPAQTVGGRLVGPFSWGPRYWLVPTSPTPLDISQIEVTSPPPQPSWTILPQQISGGPLTPGVNCFNVNSAGYISSLTLCATLLAPLFQPTITTGTTAQYFRGDLSLATFPTTWPWASITGVPSIANTVFGRSGIVTAQSGDYTTAQVIENGNLYFTNVRAQAALAGLYQSPIATGTTAQYFRGDLSLAAFPTTWAWSNLTGVPTLTNTVFGRSGTVSAQSGDYAGIYEPVLGNPASNGYMLTSTTGGTRSWVLPVTLGANQTWTGIQSFANINIGWALFSNGTGTNTNNLFGGGGGQIATTATHSTGFGYYALFNLTAGYSNTALGYEALYHDQSGVSNTAMGDSALFFSTGYQNVAIGVTAGAYQSDGSTGNANGAENVFIGSQTKTSGASDLNEIVIGYNATGAGTNTAVIGASNVTDVYDGGAGGAANHHQNGQFLTSRYSAVGTAIPACNATNLLLQVAVTDATSGTPGNTYASGGTWTVPLRCKYNSSGSTYVWMIE